MLEHTKKRLALMLFFVWSVHSCVDDSSEGVPDAGTIAVIADNVEAVSDEKAKLVVVEEDRLVFPASGNEKLLEKRHGDVLVSGFEAGFLRKVVTSRTVGDEIVIETEPAALTDAIVEGEVASTIDLSRCQPGGSGLQSCPLTGDGLTVGVDVSGTILVQESGAEIKIKEGSVTFSPSIDVDVKIRRGRVIKLGAVATGALDVSLILEATASTELLAQSFEETIWTSPSYTFVQFVGFVPVVEVVTLYLDVGAEARLGGALTLEAGARAGASISVGARYEDGEWTMVKEQGLGFQAVGPTLELEAGIDVRAFLRPRIDVKFYAVGGPSLAVEPYVSFGMDFVPPPPSWELSAGITGKFSAKLADEFEIFGVDAVATFGYETTLFDFKSVIASGAVDQPDAGTPTPDAGTMTDGGTSPDANVADGGTADPDAGASVGGYVRIPAGSFTMGSPPGEPGQDSDEEPQHPVTITRDFWMKATEVTQQEWQSLMGNNPSQFISCGGDCPVETVNWFESVAYSNALSQSEGLQECYVLSGCTSTPGQGMECTSVSFVGLDCTGYRLPTEAEWEYAARAGSTTALWNGSLAVTDCGLDPNLGAVGWYCGTSSVTYQECRAAGRFACAGTHPVGQKPSNPWGLHDIYGNVYEWVHDWHDAYSPGPAIDPTGPSGGSQRVGRGGRWDSFARLCRSAGRGSSTPEARDDFIGFRTARTAL